MIFSKVYFFWETEDGGARNKNRSFAWQENFIHCWTRGKLPNFSFINIYRFLSFYIHSRGGRKLYFKFTYPARKGNKCICASEAIISNLKSVLRSYKTFLLCLWINMQFFARIASESDTCSNRPTDILSYIYYPKIFRKEAAFLQILYKVTYFSKFFNFFEKCDSFFIEEDINKVSFWLRNSS